MAETDAEELARKKAEAERRKQNWIKWNNKAKTYKDKIERFKTLKGKIEAGRTELGSAKAKVNEAQNNLAEAYVTSSNRDKFNAISNAVFDIDVIMSSCASAKAEIEDKITENEDLIQAAFHMRDKYEPAPSGYTRVTYL